MVTLDDLVDPQVWAADVAAGFIRRRTHPSLPLVSWNYGPAAQYERHWTEATRLARGLITHADTGVVLARPLPKFFNHDETGAPAVDPHAPARVMEKVDGSLGVVYPLPGGGHAVATRGSFDSPQARHATALWNARYAGRVSIDPAHTWLVEIVHPANRIVVDYGTLDDLVLLDIVEIATGATVTDPAVHVTWPGPRADLLPAASLAQALATPVPADAEGFVVHDLTTDTRVKIKGANYKRLHLLLTDLTTGDLWANLTVARLVAAGVPVNNAARAAGIPPEKAAAIAEAGEGWADPLLDAVPDEFHHFITSHIDAWDAAARGWVMRTRSKAAALGLTPTSDRAARKEAAATIAAVTAGDKATHAALMAYVNGTDLLAMAYRSAQPRTSQAFWNTTAAA